MASLVIRIKKIENYSNGFNSDLIVKIKFQGFETRICLNLSLHFKFTF
jgi:hypothetical protein